MQKLKRLKYLKWKMTLSRDGKIIKEISGKSKINYGVSGVAMRIRPTKEQTLTALDGDTLSTIYFP